MVAGCVEVGSVVLIDCRWVWLKSSLFLFIEGLASSRKFLWTRIYHICMSACIYVFLSLFFMCRLYTWRWTYRCVQAGMWGKFVCAYENFVRTSSWEPVNDFCWGSHIINIICSLTTSHPTSGLSLTLKFDTDRTDIQYWILVIKYAITSPRLWPS